VIYIQRTKKQYEGGGYKYLFPVSPGAETIGTAETFCEAARLIAEQPKGWIYYASTRPCRNWRTPKEA